MKKEKSLISKITEISNKAPVTSPIQQENLVSKVNSLTFHTCANSLSKPQNKSFNNEKGYTLNQKSIIDALVKISDVSSVAELFSKIYSIICQNIDSDFMAYGLFKEKSNCINLNLKDKTGNLEGRHYDICGIFERYW